MGNVAVIWASAPSLDKLERELSCRLAEYDADDIVSISHSSTVVGRETGGVWGPRRRHEHTEYSALVLVKNAGG